MVDYWMLKRSIGEKGRNIAIKADRTFGYMANSKTKGETTLALFLICFSSAFVLLISMFPPVSSESGNSMTGLGILEDGLNESTELSENTTDSPQTDIEVTVIPEEPVRRRPVSIPPGTSIQLPSAPKKIGSVTISPGATSTLS
ncbi:MAG: hypothetical protein V1911_02600 [Candidatus Micrarchaeota archaeon]